MPFLTRGRQVAQITSMSFLTRRQRERTTSMFGILVFMPNALPIRSPLIGFTMPFAQSQLLATLCGEPTGGTPARRLEKHHHSPQERRRAPMTNMAQNRSEEGRAFPQVARQSDAPSFSACSHDAVIRVYDEAAQRSNETHEHIGRLVAVLSSNRLSTLIAQTGVSLARQFGFHWARKTKFSFRAKSA